MCTFLLRIFICVLCEKCHLEKSYFMLNYNTNSIASTSTSLFLLHFHIFTIEPLPLHLWLTANDEFMSHWGEMGIWAKTQYSEPPVEADNPRKREVAFDVQLIPKQLLSVQLPTKVTKPYTNLAVIVCKQQVNILCTNDYGIIQDEILWIWFINRKVTCLLVFLMALSSTHQGLWLALDSCWVTEKALSHNDI